MHSFDIVSSLRYDPILCSSHENAVLCERVPTDLPCLYMPEYHIDRILAAVSDNAKLERHISAGESISHSVETSLADFISSLDCSSQEPRKVRVVLHPSNDTAVSSSPVPRTKLENLFPRSLNDLLRHDRPRVRVHVSKTRTQPSYFTRHKTSERAVYNEVRDQISQETDPHLTQEILLINEQDEIMEGSITTPYFRKGPRWVTPAGESGGNLGTTRRWALEQGLCTEEVVRESLLYSGALGKEIILSNGVRGFEVGELAT